MAFFAGRRLPRWHATLMHMIAQPAVHAGLPWLISRGATRHGWEAGQPGLWNIAGLVPVLLGCCVMICSREEMFEVLAGDEAVGEDVPGLADAVGALEMTGPAQPCGNLERDAGQHPQF